MWLQAAGCMWPWLCAPLCVMTAALTTGQLWAGCHAVGLFVCLKTGTMVPLPSCLAQQSQHSAGLSPHPEGNPPRAVPQRSSQPWGERARVARDQTPHFCGCLAWLLLSLTRPEEVRWGGETHGKGHLHSSLRSPKDPAVKGDSPKVPLSQPSAHHWPFFSAHIPFLRSLLQGPKL